MHWRNSNFQIRHFILGKCQTIDEGYRVLLELKEERETALEVARAESLRIKARVMRLEQQPTPKLSDKLMVEAELIEINAHKKTTQSCIDAAQVELNYINELLEMLEPHRKYSHLPLVEAHQAAQKQEWAERLRVEGESQILTGGTLSAEHYRALNQIPGGLEILDELFTLQDAMERGDEFMLQASAMEILLLGE